MQRLLFLFIALTSLPTYGIFYVGGGADVFNFFILPKNTNLSTSPNSGLGTIFGGIEFGILGIDAFMASDRTGSLSGTGTLFGQTGTIEGKFKVFTLGVEARVSLPVIPIFFRLGIGKGNLDTDDVTVTSGGNVQRPFVDLGVSSISHFGVGLIINLTLFQLFGNVDAVYVKISEPLPAGLSVSGLVYFRTVAGVIVSL